jgi:sterol desaturase/sphingolipid hydroxylase (fatty acid hydroxylase superfamily)
MFTNAVITQTFWNVFWALTAFAGVLALSLEYMAQSPRFAQHRIRPYARNRYSFKKQVINSTLNQIMSLLWIIGFFVYFGEQVFDNTWQPSLARCVGEVLGVLLVYDFIYYWYHRAAHHPKMMRYMHGTHHWVRNPTATQSSYLNPLEATGALFILFGSVWLFSPVSHLSFALIYFIYSSVNLLVHSSLVPAHPALRVFAFWASKHDAHHQLFRVNFANIFPFWDALFGTTEELIKKAHPHSK